MVHARRGAQELACDIGDVSKVARIVAEGVTVCGGLEEEPAELFARRDAPRVVPHFEQAEE
jgi:3-keto-L-gulonate-6-phosphate decarboxylase